MNTPRAIMALMAAAAALVGCNANQGVQRAGTVDVISQPKLATLDDVQATIHSELKQIATTTQEALVAYSKTTNSSYDKFSTWVMAAGVVLLGLSYPVGKLVWLICGKAKQLTTVGEDP